MANNNQLDATSYYRLPCGRFLEDYIKVKNLPFDVASALKYRWRKGNKDGESEDKDEGKAQHYIRFISNWDGRRTYDEVSDYVDSLRKEAMEWDGESELDGERVEKNADLCEDYADAMNRYNEWCEMELKRHGKRVLPTIGEWLLMKREKVAATPCKCGANMV